MTDAQRSAFSAGTGGIEAMTVLLAIAAIVAAAYLLWLAWLAFSLFRAWWRGEIELLQLKWVLLRAAILVLLVTYFVRP